MHGKVLSKGIYVPYRCTTIGIGDMNNIRNLNANFKVDENTLNSEEVIATAVESFPFVRT